MKKMILLAVLPFLMVGCESVKVLDSENVPSEILEYVNNHFPENPILQVVKDKDGLELTYDVTLEGGYFLEFNRKRKVTDIEGISKLPDSVIPAPIIEFVQTNYSANYIIGWELDDSNQQVKLDNKLELEFNMSGVFLRIDS